MNTQEKTPFVDCHFCMNNDTNDHQYECPMKDQPEFIVRAVTSYQGMIDQHGRDSAELRRLCAHRDEWKKQAQDLAARVQKQNDLIAILIDAINSVRLADVHLIAREKIEKAIAQSEGK